MADNNIIAELPALRWRDLVAPPYDLVTFEFKNELAPRQVPYLDGEVHDFTGRRSFPMTARLFFLNTLNTTINGQRLFPEYWETWKEQIDGEVGELVHPILGPLQARIESTRGELRSETRAGVIIDITWVETIVNPAFGDFLAVLQVDPATLAAAADESAAEFDVIYPDGLAQSSLEEAWLAIRTGIFSLTRPVLEEIRQLQGTVADMTRQVEALNTNSAWVAHDNLVSFWSALNGQVERLQRALRPVGKEVVRFDTTLDAIATRKGNALKDLMSLNLALLRSPIVTRGTTISFYLS